MNLIKRTDVLREIHYILNSKMGKEKSLKQLEHHIKDYCEVIEAIPVKWIEKYALALDDSDEILRTFEMIGQWEDQNESNSNT